MSGDPDRQTTVAFVLGWGNGDRVLSEQCNNALKNHEQTLMKYVRVNEQTFFEFFVRYYPVFSYLTRRP
jgi:hypothetical protein